MMSLLLFFTAFIVFITAFGAIYQFLLGGVYFILCRKNTKLSGAKNHFTILIPAHNESLGLLVVLENIKAINYPTELFRIVVVADNCSDDTAKIAREAGVTCLERFDTERRGKGAALAWSIPYLLEPFHASCHKIDEISKTKQSNLVEADAIEIDSDIFVATDAIFVVDADCFVDANVLFVANTAIESGVRVLQLSNLVSNPDESFGCYAMALARIIENKLFYWPKSKLGLIAPLLGTGMVLHRNILEQYPWQSGGLAEDAEYTFCLLSKGIIPVYCGDAGVSSPFPVDSKTLAVQRARWMHGGISAVKRSFGHLLLRGICTRNLSLIDFGVASMYVSRPIVALQVFLSSFFSFWIWWSMPSFYSTLLLGISIGTILLYGIYALLGAFVLGLNHKRFYYLIAMPIFVINYVQMTFKSLLFRPPKTWNRTPRK
ncbi:MAG: glycosyltransferase family 2 protein [Thermoguttaceae bacterium]